MQTSGTCPPLSDGMRKTIVGAKAPARTGVAAGGRSSSEGLKPSAPLPHRRGGYAKHAKGGK
jgi:hypothetical protein